MAVFEQRSALFTTYRARLVFRDKLVGGIPKDPKLIEGWLRTKAGIDRAQELREAMLRTLAEVGADVDANMPFDELVEASSTVAATRQTTGFKVGSPGRIHREPAGQGDAEGVDQRRVCGRALGSEREGRPIPRL